MAAEEGIKAGQILKAAFAPQQDASDIEVKQDGPFDACRFDGQPDLSPQHFGMGRRRLDDGEARRHRAIPRGLHNRFEG